MPTETTIQKASELSGETEQLALLLQDLTDICRYQNYSDWLDGQEDAKRAEFIRDYAAALKTGGGFPNTEGFSEAWLSITGTSLAQACCDHSLTDERFTLLALAKPALRFESDMLPDPLEEDSFPVAASKRFGIPDLPVGSIWPRQKDCRSLYDPDSGIDPETPCSFVAQINCKNLQGTQLASFFPKSGLISFFSCGEFQEIGMVDGHVIFSPDTSTLVRIEPPEEIVGDDADEANQLAEPVAFKFVESLEVPYPGSESPFEQIQWSYSDERSDQYEAATEAANMDPLNSLGGFTRPTSGDDPLPGAEWCKLMAMPNSTDSRLHFCIKYEDLAAGTFSNVELAWVDFD